MNNLLFNQLQLKIEHDVISNNGESTYILNFFLKNGYKKDVLDVLVYLFVDDENLYSFSKCINKISIIKSDNEKVFSFKYKSININPKFHIRIIYRLYGENTHRYFNYEYLNDPSEMQNIQDSFIALLNINGLKKIIDVFPIINGLSFTNFGSILDTSVNITYLNYDNIISQYNICRSTLLKGYNSISLSNISYGSFSTLSFGNSILLEIPILINQK